MKRKILSILLALVLVLSFSLVTAVPVAAQDSVPDRVTAITTTADRLVDLQSTMDYGWDWIVTELSAHSANPSAYNMYGVVILGLLDAYGETGTASYLAAATGMADHMTSGEASNGDFYKQGGEQEPAGAYDYQFLMRYAEVSGDSTYSDYAIALWAWNKANTAIFASPSALNDALLDWAGASDLGAAAWQLAAFGTAIHAMGDDTFATGCAALIVADLDPETGQEYLVGDHMALAECLEFLNELDPATYSSTIDDITAALVAAQKADGCWDDGYAGTFQDTAYAVRALAVYGGTDGLNAARKGAAWLIANQLENGGWLDDSDGSPEEYSEQDAEGLRALVATAAPVTIAEKGYYTIQQAIDAASPEATINVANGIYAEQIVINESLTLIGESRDGVIINGSSFQETNIKGIWINSSNVTVKNLTVENFGPQWCYSILAIEQVDSEGGAHPVDIANEGKTLIPLSYVKIENVKFDNNATGPYLVYSQNSTVQDCVITAQLGDGIWMSWGCDDATILHNEVINSGNQGIWLGRHWRGSPPVTKDGVIQDNTVNGALEAGIWFAGDGCTIENNEVMNIQGEGWSNGAVTLGVNAATSNVVVRYNKIHDSNTHGIGISAASDVTQTHINFNNISNNTLGVDNASGNSVDATMNWWGDASGPAHASNPLGTGDSVSDSVDFFPWALNEGCTEIANSDTTVVVVDDAWVGSLDYTQVLIDSADYYIGVNAFAIIQDGIDTVAEGGTVIVAAGEYLGQVIINKPLTLEGAQAGVDARTRSGDESVIDGGSTTENYYLVQIKADNVIFDGFTVTLPLFEGQADASGILTHIGGPWSNMRITNCIIHDIGAPTRTLVDFGSFAINSGPVDGLEIDHNLMYNLKHSDPSFAWNNAIIVWGSSPTVLASNVNIHDNKMYDIQGPASPETCTKLYDGGIFISSDCANVVIDNNEFTNCGEYGVSSNIGTGSAVSITNNVISGSTVAGIRCMDKADTITGNTISGCGAGIQVRGEATAAPTVHLNNISGNTIGLENNASFTIDATYNWWGGIGGPGGEGLGNGDNVTANVDYDPWLTEDFDKVITDGIRSYGSDAIELQVGWNTLSMPCGLKDSADTFGEIQAMGDYLISSIGADQNYLGGYWYDAQATEGWKGIEAKTELEPGKGFYIRMSDASRFPVLYYDGGLYLPSYPVWEGWNLVGSMFGIDKVDGDKSLDDEGDWGVASLNADDNGALTGDSESHMDKDTALNSLKTAASVVVSPSVPGQLLSWAEVYGTGGEAMCVGEAYWVFMLDDGTLAGFEVTPFYFTYTAPAP